MKFKKYSSDINYTVANLQQSAWQKDQIYKQVKVYFNTPDELTILQSMHLDIIQTKENYIDIVTFQDGLDDIVQNGYQDRKIIHEDLTKFYKSWLDATLEIWWLQKH